MLFTKPDGGTEDMCGEKRLVVAAGLTVVIRPLARYDARDLQQNCFPTESYAAVMDYVRRGLHFVERGQAAHLVAQVHGQVVANAQLLCWHKRAEIGSLVVAERLRRRGIGTALIQALSEAAHQLGAEQIEIGADKRSTRVLDLYQRLGFAPYKEVHLPGDIGGEDIVYMIKPAPLPV